MVEEILLQHKSFFCISGVVENMIRWLLWKIVSGLTYVADSLEGVLNKIYTLNSFFNNPQVEALINSFKPVFWCLLAISILYIGYKIVIDREFKGERLFQNFIVASMVICLLPTFMCQLEEITTTAVKSLKVNEQTVTGEITTTARNIIKDNLYDLKYLEKNDFKLGDYENDSSVATNSLNPQNILNLNINEVMNKGGFLNPQNEVFSKKIELDINGDPQVVKLDKAFFNLIQEEYYRFNFDFLNIIVSLLCLILTFILTSIKIGRIIVELAFKKIFAIVLAFSDIASGQKLKTVLKDILSSFAIIFVTALLLKLYTIGITWVGTLNVTWLIKLVFTVVLSLMVIDGPNIIERVLGIDAGIKSGWGLIAGTYAGLKTTGEIGKIASNAIGTATKTMTNLGAGVAGAYDGFKGKTLEDERNENTNSLSSETLNNSKDSISSISDKNLEDSSNTRNISENSLQDNLLNNKGDINLDSSNDISKNDSISNGYGNHKPLSDEINSSENMNKQNNVLEDNKSNSFTSSSLGNNEEKIDSKPQNTLENDRNMSNQDISNKQNRVNETLEDDRSKNTQNTSNSANIVNETLENDRNSNNKNISNGSQGKLENDIKNENSKSKIDDKSANNLSNKISDKDIVNKSNKLETRTFGQYAKDKISSSKQVENSKKYYQLGVNTGEKLNRMINSNKNKNQERK